MLYTYNAIIKRIIDGDTIEAELDLGFKLKFTSKFRIKDLDTPEVYRPKSEAEKLHGKKASEFAKELLLNKQVTIITEPVPGIYGRYLASIVLPNGNWFADVMIENGFQKKEKY